MDAAQRGMRFIFFLLACLMLMPPAAALAMVGGAREAGITEGARHAVLIVSSRGSSCTGTAIARDLVLTAAHCVLPGADYKLVEFDAARRPVLKDIAAIVRHPAFDVGAVLRHRSTADVALLKLAAPLSNPAVALAPADVKVAPGDRLTVIGSGLAVPGDGKTGGTARTATLIVIGRQIVFQIRLVDPATKGERAGLGACTGDSGAPVFQETGNGRAVIGLVSWSTGPNNTAGCGGLTGVTPLARYRDWIAETARRLGSIDVP